MRVVALKRLILLSLLACSACASGGPTSDQMAAQDDATCQGYGESPGTDSYQQCMEQLQLDHFQDADDPRKLMYPELQDNPLQ
jgi:hypothetical protein